MIPFALVTGFLGSGKTTYLTQLARRYASGPGRVAFLVNEFAATDIDSPQVVPVADLVVSVCGGSIFCRCRAEEYLQQLTTIARATPDLAGLVVEASGMANPAVARSMLAESGLDRTYRWAGCVCLVDPGSLQQRLGQLASAERQVAVADVVLLNKCDLYPEDILARTEATIAAINPQARIQRTIQAASDLDPLVLQSQRWFDGELALCADPAVVAIEVPLDGNVDPPVIERDLAEVGEGLLRAKGFMRVKDGWRTFDWAGGVVTWRASGPGPSAMVLLVRAQAADHARVVARRLATEAICC